ncbi:MAG: beta-propeller fold lactonase family protein, partial [Candidatus Eremiobacteraeota bacterium]|nr:beta-propeller fold lactonase family protein [Candidatus Eremiobacteraeota bacterium]
MFARRPGRASPRGGAYVFLVAIVLVVLLTGCLCGHNHRGFGPCPGDEDSTDSSSSGSGSGLLYVSNTVSNSWFRFEGVSALDGNEASTTPVAGGLTNLSGPAFLFFDSTNNRLYLTNTTGNSVIVFSDPDTLVGNVAPVRILSGNNTGFSSPTHVQVDISRDLLYVSNTGGSNILVFESASTVEGNVVPDRVIAGVNTQLAGNQGLLLDEASDRLIVANGNAILSFDGASTAVGNPFPTRRVTGGNTRLNAAVSLALDGSGSLYVADTGLAAILRFDSFSTLDGDVAPDAELEGSNTQHGIPGQILLDSTG